MNTSNLNPASGTSIGTKVYGMFNFRSVYDLLDDMINCLNAFQLDLVIWTVYCTITHNGTVYGLAVAYHKF